MPALNLIIADDHHLVRSGLCKLIAQHSDLHVAAECGTGREALTALDAHPCHVLIGKGVDEAELLRAIRVVAHGGRYVGPELADLLVNGMDADSDQPTHNLLSAREFQIFCRLAEGRTVGNIAVKLSLSVKTVSTYRARLLEKMGMKTNADITTYAVRNSIVQ